MLSEMDLVVQDQLSPRAGRRRWCCPVAQLVSSASIYRDRWPWLQATLMMTMVDLRQPQQLLSDICSVVYSVVDGTWTMKEGRVLFEQVKLKFMASGKRRTAYHGPLPRFRSAWRCVRKCRLEVTTTTSSSLNRPSAQTTTKTHRQPVKTQTHTNAKMDSAK